MKVVAVDPGLTTGIAWSDEPFTVCESVELPPMQAVGAVMDLAPDAVICEDYTPRPGRTTTWQPDALHVIGALRYETWAAHRRSGWERPIIFELRRPFAKARVAALNEDLAELGWCRPTKGGHEDSARRFLLDALRRHGWRKDL